MSDTTARTSDENTRHTRAELVNTSEILSAVSQKRQGVFTVTSRRTGSVTLRITPRESIPTIDTVK